MIPRYLTGEEFQYVDIVEDKILNSPTGEIHALVAHYKDHFVTLVNVEGTWTSFEDEKITQIGCYEDVILKMLEESLFPFIMIYKVGDIPEEIEENPKVNEIIYEYFDTKPSTKGKKNILMETGLKNEENKEEILYDKDTNNENSEYSEKIMDAYDRRGIHKSLLNSDSRKSKGKTSKMFGGKC
jgi:hypothetical protein